MVKVTPVVFRMDVHNSPNGGEILLDNGHFFIREETLAELRRDVEAKKNESNMMS
jgi:hypothetical protein